MGQTAHHESIITVCDDCGRSYRVSPAQVGKQVKCKACGHAFRIAEVKPAVTEPVAESGSPIRDKLNVLVDYLLYFNPNGWVLLGLLAFAILLGFNANRVPDLFSGSLYGFPILAGVFLIVGFTAAVISAVLSPEEFKAPWSDLLSVAGGILIGGLIGVFVIRYRRKAIADDEFGLFFQRVVRLVFRVMGVAAMSLVLILVAVGTGHEPRPAPTAFDQRVAERAEQQRNPQRFSGVSVPARLPFHLNR